jgi:glycosyltransferase involved in cell wall biosynthesis
LKAPRIARRFHLGNRSVVEIPSQMTKQPNSGKRDVTIYSPHANALYERGGGTEGGGGAELQTTLLAKGLAERGMRVGHVVYPVRDPRPLQPPAPDIVERRMWTESRLHPLHELASVWSALSDADARAVIVRGSGGYVVPAAAWCRAHGRALVFAASNDLDFDLARPDRHAATLRAYGLAARQASRLIVQTQRQAELAHETFPRLNPVLIPSFAQPAAASDGKGAYFLWVDRLTSYKHPEKLLDLAAAVPEGRFRMVAPETTETSPQLRERVHSRAAALANVELVPRLSREQLLEQMDGAAAVVKTSEVEGMPNTFLEAWSRGLPVLSLSVDPDRRIAEHGVGLLAGGSMDRFADQARDLWQSAELRSEIGLRAREFVIATHSPQAVVDKWAALLGELLEIPNGS